MASIQKRTSGNGDTSYRVQVRLKGYPPQQATFKRLTDARDWAQQTETAMKQRRFFKTAEAKRHTVADMIDRYLETLLREKPKRYHDLKTMLSWWRSELGYCILADLTTAQISEKIDKLSKRTKRGRGGKPKLITASRVNRYISALSHVCTVAHNEWEWLEQHPMKRIKKKKEPRGRVRFLDDEERVRLLDACKQANSRYMYIIVVLAMSTGARRGELTNLKWKDIDLKRQVITLHETKNDERRVLPLAGHALELIQSLSEQRDIASEFVFASYKKPNQPWDSQSAWKFALKRSGVKDFRFHDLRHTAASYLAMNGASLAEIAEVLGHKTLAMVKRYAHLSEAHTSSVVASMNKKVFG
jgi:integrase